MQLIRATVFLVASTCYAQNVFAFPAANYYVDQAHGSDSNSGTRSAPFQTISKLSSVLTAGQVAALACGSQWREQLTLPGTNTGVVSYGDCPTSQRPLLDASNTISAGAWSKTGGFTSIYQATVTTDNLGGTGFLSIWENGVQFKQSVSQVALDSNPGNYFVTNNGALSGTSQVVFVNATGSTNPGSNGNTYECNSRTYGLFSQYSSVVSNVKTRRNYGNNGSLEVGQFSYVTNVEADEGTKHNALLHAGSRWVGVTLNNSYYAGGGKIALVLNDNAPTGQDAWIENAAYTETFETGGEGFFGHVNTSGNFGLVTLKNCSTVGTATSIGGYASTAMTVDGGSFDGAISLASSISTILNVTSTGGISIPYGGTIEIGNVAASFASATGTIYAPANLVTPLSLYVHDSTISNSTAFSNGIGFYTAPVSLTLLRNTFLAPVQINHIGGPASSSIPVTPAGNIDFNTYHYPSAATWINYRGTAYDIHGSGWAAWQALGYDTHGTRVTP